MQQAIQALKDTLGSDDTEQIKAKTEALAQASMKVGEALYKAQQAQQAGAGEGGPPVRPRAAKPLAAPQAAAPTTRSSTRISRRSTTRRSAAPRKRLVTEMGIGCDYPGGSSAGVGRGGKPFNRAPVGHG